MIDIHTHTNYSDGSSSAKELLETAEKLGLTLLSITDHNTIEAYRELANPTIRNIFKGKIIPGIEITTTYKGETIEVLGYGFDFNKMYASLKENVLTFEKKQLKEFDLIKNKFQKIGVKFNPNQIKFNPSIESCRAAFLNEIKQYPDNNKFFLETTSFDNLASFTRNEIYNPKSALYVDESSLFPTLEKTLEMIHSAEGIAFLAHPFAYSKNIPESLTDLIKNYNFDGLECYYTTFSKDETNYLLKLCEERNMYISGGSDFHGTRKQNHFLGTGNNNLNITEDIVKNWITKFIPNTRIVTSYYEPDLDAVASSYAYAEYLNKRNQKSDYFIYGLPKKEVQIVTNMFGITLRGANNIKINQDIIILDTNNYDEFKYIHKDNIIEIIDHHKKTATQELFPNAKIHIELLGAVATIIAEKFKNHDITPSKEAAILLFYAIISNTINLHSKTTTQKDKDMLDWLASLYDEISYNRIEEIFIQKSKIEETNLRHEMEAELIFNIANSKITVAQLEIANLEDFLKLNKYKINQILETIKIEKQLDYIFINCVDILDGFNILLTVDEKTTSLLEKAYNLSFINNEAKTQHLILRKELIDNLINYMTD